MPHSGGGLSFAYYGCGRFIAGLVLRGSKAVFSRELPWLDPAEVVGRVGFIFDPNTEVMDAEFRNA